MKKQLLILCLLLIGFLFPFDNFLQAASTTLVHEIAVELSSQDLKKAEHKPRVLKPGRKNVKQDCSGVKKHASKNSRKAVKKCYKF